VEFVHCRESWKSKFTTYSKQSIRMLGVTGQTIGLWNGVNGGGTTAEIANLRTAGSTWSSYSSVAMLLEPANFFFF
jgi:hypothetical protein